MAGFLFEEQTRRRRWRTQCYFAYNQLFFFFLNIYQIADELQSQQLFLAEKMSPFAEHVIAGYRSVDLPPVMQMQRGQ